MESFMLPLYYNRLDVKLNSFEGNEQSLISKGSVGAILWIALELLICQILNILSKTKIESDDGAIGARPS